MADPGIKAISDQAKEAHKGMQKIIALWKIGIEDPEPTIRLFTLIASLIGFLLLVIVIFFSAHCILYFNSGAEASEFPFHHYLFGSIGSVAILLPVGFPAAMSLTNRAQTKMLATGFKNIYAQKYGSEKLNAL